MALRKNNDNYLPSIDVREDRLKEIYNMLDVLNKNRDELNKQINQLIFEAKIIQDMTTLEKFVNGEIDIQLKPIKDGLSKDGE